MPLDPKAKYRLIYERFYSAITSGEYAAGQQIPTEVQLAREYETSRPTVAKALRALEQGGFLLRRRGVGTFVVERPQVTGRLLGLIVPRPGEGIFTPMCNGIMDAAEAQGYGLLLAGSFTPAQGGEVLKEDALCEQLISRKVAGLFFGPLDVPPAPPAINQRITERLDRAGIPIVLVDRDICRYPARSKFDLVGINNRRESARITEHLLKLGCRRIEFVRGPSNASTTLARIEGYKDAMAAHGVSVDPTWIHTWDEGNPDFVRDLIRPPHAEAFVCVNDRFAGDLMHNLATLGVRVPDDVRLVGFDDNPEAARLPVPLTTVRQPAAYLGAMAARMLLERIADPAMPPREMMLSCELIVRSSCGAKLQKAAVAAG